MEWFVSPDGKDSWSGRLATVSADGKDGPLASLAGARNAVRRARLQAGGLGSDANVTFAGGRYLIDQPVVFSAEDSGPITYRAAAGQAVFFDGGVRVSNFKQGVVNGRKCWVALLDDVRLGKAYYRSLYVNGRRRLRPQLPKPAADPRKRAFFRMKDVPGNTLDSPLFGSTNAFIAAKGDVKPWKNLNDVEIVACHFWVECRLPIDTFDRKSGLVTSKYHSRFALKDDFNRRWAKYYVDNVFEALSEPGEWYLDRPSGRLFYLPMKGEKIDTAEVYLPRVEQLIDLTGDPENGKFVEHVRFEGITFCHTDWHLPSVLNDKLNQKAPPKLFGGGGQGAAHLPGVIQLRGARFCAIENCTIEAGGFYAIDLADGCTGNRLIGNTVRQMGGGGIKQSGGNAVADRKLRTGATLITDNHIHDVGQVFHSGIGVLSMHAYGSRIAHNHIHDLFYSTISVGWVWGYAESVSFDNVIEFNHCHDYGRNWLADMGGVYLLGVAPGTVVRNNLIHDAMSPTYGGWGIYFDEGSAHVLAENNVCYNFSSQPFHCHYGRENTVRNNVLAFGAEAQIALSRGEAHRSFTLQRNVIVSAGRPIYVGGYACQVNAGHFLADLNCFWDTAGKPLFSATKKDTVAKPEAPKDFAAWKKESANDAHSVIADVGVGKGFTGQLDMNAEALKAIGFCPIDLSKVGPRPAGERD